VAAAVGGSVALGRRGPATRRVRRLVVAGNAALAVFALLLMAELGSSETYDDFRDSAATVAVFRGPVSGLRADAGYPGAGGTGVMTEKWPPAGSDRTAMRP
jgi:hypothetical protein